MPAAAEPAEPAEPDPRSLTVTIVADVPLDQSAHDSISGLPLVEQGSDAPPSPLTNATSPTQPADRDGWASGTLTFDLGDAGGDELVVRERRLDRLSIWVFGDDDARNDFRGRLLLSTDGKSFHEVPGSTVRHDQASVERFLHVRYVLGPKAAVGFRYLRVELDHVEPRIAEIDAWVTEPDPQPKPFP